MIPGPVSGPSTAGKKRSLTDHVVGNMDLDLSLVLEGHLALDALVCLLLFGNQKERNQRVRKKQKSKVSGQPDSRLSRRAPGRASLSHCLPTSL